MFDKTLRVLQSESRGNSSYANFRQPINHKVRKMNKILLVLFCSLLVFSCKKEESTQPPSNNAPGTPSNPSPGDGTTGVSRSPILSWTCSDPDAGDSVKYDIYLSSVNPPNTLVAANREFPNYAMSGLDTNRTYYWRITARDSKGAWSEGPIWRMTTLVDTSLRGLVAYYPFNGNANDESGMGNNGTVHGSTLTTDKFGQVNKAYSFDGDSNYIQVPNASSLRPASALTVSVLVQPKGFYAGRCQGNSIIEKGADGDVGYYGIRYDENNGIGSNCDTFDPVQEKFSFLIHFADGSTVGVSSTTFAQLNTWYFVTGTYDGGNMKLYVNGILENTIPVTKVLGSNTRDVSIGRLFGLPGFHNWVNGVLDNIRIYNRALSANEIQAAAHDLGW